MSQGEATIEWLPPEILLKILENIVDARTLLCCQTVCQSWRQQASSVRQLFIAYNSPSPTSGRQKLAALSHMLEFFPHVQRLHVRLDTSPSDSGDQGTSSMRYGTTCMRYAEIGATVDKFVHVAAKSGATARFCCTRGNAAHADLVTPLSLPSSPPRSEESPSPPLNPSPSRRHLSPVKMDLKQVLQPSNHYLKRMGPLIIFAIIRGFDDFRESIPALLAKYPNLQSLLYADVTENVTINLRSHHVSEIRRLGEGPFAGPQKLEGMFQAALSIFETDPPENAPSQPPRAEEQSPLFDISFWRAEEVSCGTCMQGPHPLRTPAGDQEVVAANEGGGVGVEGSHLEMSEVSVCIATCQSVPLQAAEIEDLESLAVGGVVLASLIEHVNKLSPSCKLL